MSEWVRPPQSAVALGQQGRQGGSQAVTRAVPARVTVMAAAVAAVTAAFAAVPAPAHSLAYERAYQFSTQDAGAAVGVNRATGHVYVAQPLAFTIRRFDAAGDPLDPSSFGSSTYGGVAVAQGSGLVHAFDASLDLGTPSIVTFDAAGSPSPPAPIAVTANPLPAFEFNQIAVDSAGVIYYPNAVSDSVEKLGPAGDSLGSIGAGGALVDPSGVAVSPAGDVYVVDRVVNGGTPCDSPPCPDDVTAGRVQRFPAGGGAPVTIDGAGASSVAVDPASGDVLVGNGIGSSFEVVVYDAQGAELTSFGSGVFGGSGILSGYGNEIAVSATRRVYVTDPGSAEVEMFDVLPEVATGTALDVGRERATLTATVDPSANRIFGCRFEYGTTTEYGGSVPCASLPPAGDSPVPVSAEVAGLAPGTAYHFRIVAGNRGGTSNGDDATFTTDAAPTPPTPPSPPPGASPPAPASPSAGPPAPCVTGCAAAPRARLTVRGTARVRSARARIVVRCVGSPGAECAGRLKLVAKLSRAGGGRRARTVGRASYDLAAGEARTLRVRLSRRARRALARSGRLEARVSGTGLSSRTVTLRGAKTRKRVQESAR
jgi:hypothetical protein